MCFPLSFSSVFAVPDEYAKLFDILLLFSLDFSPWLNMHLFRTLTFSVTSLVPYYGIAIKRIAKLAARVGGARVKPTIHKSFFSN